MGSTVAKLQACLKDPLNEEKMKAMFDFYDEDADGVLKHDEVKDLATDLVALLEANAVKVPFRNVVSDDKVYKTKLFEQLKGDTETVSYAAIVQYLRETSGNSNWNCTRMKFHKHKDK